MRVGFRGKIGQDAVIRMLQEGNWKEKNPDVRDDEDNYFKDNYRRYVELLKTIMKYSWASTSLLDVSCMFGHVAIALKQLRFSVDVTDLPAQVEKRRTKFWSYGINMMKCDLNTEDIPYTSESFDTVLLAEVLEHIHPARVPHTFKEVNRVLRTGGKLYITTPNLVDFGNRLLLLMGKDFLDISHIKEYLKEDLERELLYSGFRIIESRYSLCYAYYHSLSKGYANFAKPFLLPFRYLYPKFRTTIIMVAEKI